jgi:hypothetical protein
MMEDFLILILLIGLFIIANIRAWLTFKYIMHKNGNFSVTKTNFFFSNQHFFTKLSASFPLFLSKNTNPLLNDMVLKINKLTLTFYLLLVCLVIIRFTIV